MVNSSYLLAECQCASAFIKNLMFTGNEVFSFGEVIMNKTQHSTHHTGMKSLFCEPMQGQACITEHGCDHDIANA